MIAKQIDEADLLKYGDLAQYNFILTTDPRTDLMKVTRQPN